MRDLQKDLDRCHEYEKEIKLGMHRSNYDIAFAKESREGWPYAIERAIKAEAEVTKWQDVAEQRLENALVVAQKVCRLEAENAKLRKVAEAGRELISFNWCNSKECKKCDPKYIGFCMWSEIGQALAELDKAKEGQDG
jgi:hypothetical protein